jgi:ABC-type multidrug transport system fused ATPase/permease subunit
MKLIGDTRHKELQRTRGINMVRGFSVALQLAIVPFAAFACLLCFRLAGNELTINNVFMTLALFLSIRLSCGVYFPLSILSTFTAFTVLQRLQRVLEDLEVAKGDDGSSIDCDRLPDKNQAFRLSRASFRWSAADTCPTLQNISVGGAQGSFTAVIGPVGAGKSTLLMLLLRELAPQQGSVTIGCPTTVYAPQQPWVLSRSVRSNIVFGHEYQEDWYLQGE